MVACEVGVRGAPAPFPLQTGMLTAAVHLPQPEPWRGSSKSRWDKEKQGCWSCGETFNSITKRKHRCKLCGVVSLGRQCHPRGPTAAPPGSQGHTRTDALMQTGGSLSEVEASLILSGV